MPRRADRDAAGVIGDWIGSALTALDALPLWQLCTVVGVLLVLETTVGVGLVTPGEVVLLAAATTVSGPVEFGVLTAVAALASTVGQSGGWLIGRRFGDRVRYGRLGRRVGEQHWTRAEGVLAGRGGRALVGSRFVAVVHSLVPVLAGALRMPWARFIRRTALGAVLWGLVYVGLGSAAPVALRGTAHLLGPAVTAAVVAAVAVVVAGRLVRRLRRVGAGR